ncbi:Ig-like domain-containing protein, partial [Salmonella enterica]
DHAWSRTRLSVLDSTDDSGTKGDNLTNANKPTFILGNIDADDHAWSRTRLSVLDSTDDSGTKGDNLTNANKPTF